MSIPKRVLLRDCLAVAAILLSLFSAVSEADAQVLASYTLCSVSARETCTDLAQARPCAVAARSERDDFLQWAIATHRAGLNDAGIALRTINPAKLTGDAVAQAAARSVSCSH
jgi:hypothetical protein